MHYNWPGRVIAGAFFVEAIHPDRVRLLATLVTPMKENETEYLFDEIGWKILGELQQNARIAFAELGRRVGLSTPAVTERVHKMEEAGIILGYRAQVDPAKAGLPILAFITVKVSGENLTHFMKIAASRHEVLECHRVTGADSFLLKTAVSNVAHLERLLDALMPYVATTTLMVLSTALAWGNIVKPDSASQDLAARPAFR